MKLHEKVHSKTIDEPFYSSDSNEAIKIGPRRSERVFVSSSNDPRYGSKYVEISDGESIDSNNSSVSKSSKKAAIKSRRNDLETGQDGTIESDQPRCLTSSEKHLFRSQNLKSKIESNKHTFSAQNATKKVSTISIKVSLYFFS